VQSGELVRLRDGTRAVVVPFHPVPRAAIEKAYEELSPESRFHRFLSSAPHLTDAMFHHLVEEVNGVDHIALFLVIEPDEGPESIIGVARMIRYQDDPRSVDVAVTVRDEWHGKGAATALLAALMRQRPAGVTRIVTAVSADNEAALAMLRRLGSYRATTAGHGTVRVVVDLPAAAESAS
jgi:RimJ/RimL family protein N-acetyltransferase